MHCFKSQSSGCYPIHINFLNIYIYLTAQRIFFFFFLVMSEKTIEVTEFALRAETFPETIILPKGKTSAMFVHRDEKPDWSQTLLYIYNPMKFVLVSNIDGFPFLGFFQFFSVVKFCLTCDRSRCQSKSFFSKSWAERILEPEFLLISFLDSDLHHSSKSWKKYTIVPGVLFLLMNLFLPNNST